MANNSCIFSTFVNLYYNPKNIKNFFKKKKKCIFLVLMLFISVLWLCENMILNDLRFDYDGHFENQMSNQIPIFQMSKSCQKVLKKLSKNVKKLSKISQKMSKVVKNQSKIC
jgi:amino acid permease